MQPEYLEYLLNEWDDVALEDALLIVERLGGGGVVAADFFLRRSNLPRTRDWARGKS